MPVLPGFPSWINKHTKNQRKKFDIVFVGQWNIRQHKHRGDYLNYIAEKVLNQEKEISLGLFLSNQINHFSENIKKNLQKPCFGIASHKAYASGKICFNASTKLKCGTADLVENNIIFSLRTYEITGTGSFLLAEYSENLDEYFKVGKEIETYKDMDEFFDKVKYYLKNPNIREKIALAGQKRCLKDYSMKKRAEYFDKLIKEYL